MRWIAFLRCVNYISHAGAVGNRGTANQLRKSVVRETACHICGNRVSDASGTRWRGESPSLSRPIAAHENSEAHAGLAPTSGSHFNLLSVGVIGACSENRLFSSRDVRGRGEVLARIGKVCSAETASLGSCRAHPMQSRASNLGLAEQRRVDPEHVNAAAVDIHRHEPILNQMVYYKHARFDVAFTALDAARHHRSAGLPASELAVGPLAAPFTVSLPAVMMQSGVLAPAGRWMVRRTAAPSRPRWKASYFAVTLRALLGPTARSPSLLSRRNTSAS